MLLAGSRPAVPSWLPLFAGFLTVAVFAFWPSYFASRSRLDPRFHLHAVSMFAWCSLLVGQAVLIRAERTHTHRIVGLASPVLVVLVLLSAIRLKHWRMQGFEIGLSGAYSLASVLFALAAFALFYLLAIGHRRVPYAHSRFMLCTVFTLFAPVTDRLIAGHVPAVISFIQYVTGETAIPFVNLAGFVLSDLLMLALVIWDWRGKRDVRPFAIGLATLACFQSGILLIYPTRVWAAFSGWFAGLPIS